MYTIELGVDNSKFVYVFRSNAASDEALKAKKSRPLANRNDPSKDSPEPFQSCYQSKKSFDQTLLKENTIRQKNLNDKLLLEKQEVITNLFLKLILKLNFIF